MSLIPALGFFLLLVAANGNDPDIETLLTRANQLFEETKYSSALPLFEKVLDEDPDNTMALTRSGYILYKAMYYPEARTKFSRVQSLLPNASYPLVMLGSIALQEYEPLKARAFYLRARELGHEDRDLEENLSLAEEKIHRVRLLAKLSSRSNRVFFGGIFLASLVLLAIVLLEGKEVLKTNQRIAKPK